MKLVRRALATVAVALSLVASSPLLATSFSTDQSDLWYIPAESGWGMQLVQRDNIIFATLFVYGPDGSPTWYTATMLPTGTPDEWSGDLAATTGPWFGTAPFNSANVTVAKVGTMTWMAQSVETGNVSYTVNGVAVSKNVVRQTLVLDDYNGTYLGAIKLTSTGCFDPAKNITESGSVQIVIVQKGSSMTINTTHPAGGNIVLLGTLTQAGQFGRMTGGLAVNVTVSEINGQSNYWTARLSFSASPATGCAITGTLGGMRQ